MNFALPTLAVFALLLPGFIARSRIKRIERQSLDYSPFGQIVSEALLWALALHLLWCGLAWLLTAYEPRPEVLLRLLGCACGTGSRWRTASPPKPPPAIRADGTL